MSHLNAEHLDLKYLNKILALACNPSDIIKIQDHIIKKLKEEIQQLRDEVARLLKAIRKKDVAGHEVPRPKTADQTERSVVKEALRNHLCAPKLIDPIPILLFLLLLRLSNRSFHSRSNP